MNEGIYHPCAGQEFINPQCRLKRQILINKKEVAIATS